MTVPRTLRSLFIVITLFPLSHPHLRAQASTTQALPQSPGATAAASGESAPQSSLQPVSQSSEQDPQHTPDYPVVHPVLPPKEEGITLTSTGPQTYRAGVLTVSGDVILTHPGHTLRADTLLYDSRTAEVTATGHVVLTGGANDERITATHAVYNLKTETGRFYEVEGSVGLTLRTRATAAAVAQDPTAANPTRAVYTNGNPFLFTGRLLVKTGPTDYDLYDGSITSCALPKPDWLFSSAHFAIDGATARATNSVFRLLNYPVFYLPYVTHPIHKEDRQSGFLIPDFGRSSTKGDIVGESIYLVLGRSADLTVGAQYYSLRGFAQSATLRYVGQGLDFARFHYSGLLDRGYTPPGGVYTNQGGEDAVFDGRRDLNSTTRAAADVEYLSSYIYREAFTDNFNQAVTSDVVSTAYLTHDVRGYEFAGLVERYQGIKVIATNAIPSVPATPTTPAIPAVPAMPSQQVHIFHAPSLLFSSTDHALGVANLLWDLNASFDGLQRSQPKFSTGGIVERVDFHPELAYPLFAGGWSIRPQVGARYTFYSRSRTTPYAPSAPPNESAATLSRSDLEASIEIHPPTLERTFTPSQLGGLFGSRLLGDEVRHTIEPELTYRYVGGISNFLSILRFDETDVVSDTNELEYGVTQRLFTHHDNAKCKPNELPQGPGLDAEAATAPVPDSTAGKGCGNEQLISWRLTQKTFFDPNFGNAVIDGRRNIFTTTLDLTGVAFLTEPRNISPLISRLRVRTSANTDVEWDFDLDTGAKKFTSQNVFLDAHRGSYFGALAYAYLDAPGRSYIAGVSSTVSSFNQLRVLLGYGLPTKPGFSLAANAGVNLCPAFPTANPTTSGTTAVPSANCNLLQYAAIQSSYNWNCCGLSFEYRKYELGAVRNENEYRFNFTLANIGTAGNLRRAERLF